MEIFKRGNKYILDWLPSNDDFVDVKENQLYFI